MMNNEIESSIRDNVPWPKLSKNVRQILGGSKSEYEKLIVEYSVKNQLRYRGNLIKYVKKSEELYYEIMLRYSREHLMLYPYHLSDIVVKGLRTTPFQYYLNILQDLLVQERSYDSLPNFTAQDCLRLLGIGRNQYIDLMNQCRTMKKSFRKKPIRDILPPVPVDIAVEYWWVVHLGSILEDDMKACTKDEKCIIDFVMDNGPKCAGSFDRATAQRLYSKGLIYFDIPVNDDDYMFIPPLNDFVMNRVSGDYFEKMLYKIFVSIDEHTAVQELSNILQIDVNLVKNAVSVFCRLNLAHKKTLPQFDVHNSWNVRLQSKSSSYSSLVDLTNSLIDFTPSSDMNADLLEAFEESKSFEDVDSKSTDTGTSACKRIGFMFDSTLTAFLMMGNLSTSLKSHAVTLFEAGKLTDECLDNFVDELKKINEFSEGEAQRYFEHATVLRDTIEFLRSQSELDLIRCESLMGLDPFARARLLKKNYTIIVSMAPLSSELTAIHCSDPAHLGPSVAEVNSSWFRLFLYNTIGNGPVSYLFVKGSRIKRLPSGLKTYRKLLLTVWCHDSVVVSADTCLLPLNDALQHSVVLLQGYSEKEEEASIVHVPFPCTFTDSNHESLEQGFLQDHPTIRALNEKLDLCHSCGYITLIRPKQNVINSSNDSSTAKIDSPYSANAATNLSDCRYFPPTGGLPDRDIRKTPSNVDCVGQPELFVNWILYDCVFGLPLFDRSLNRSICDRIAKFKLLTAEKLDTVKDCSSKVGKMVLDFIRDFQNMNTFDDNAERQIPYPVHTLMFDGKHVKLWDGN